MQCSKWDFILREVTTNSFLLRSMMGERTNESKEGNGILCTCLLGQPPLKKPPFRFWQDGRKTRQRMILPRFSHPNNPLSGQLFPYFNSPLMPTSGKLHLWKVPQVCWSCGYICSNFKDRRQPPHRFCALLGKNHEAISYNDW